ncbi:hypothetical protein DUNSADRAFT_11598 [Dunaliella salina]|uniref:RRM domain-containing protein n=1 Tax=Dunaliella salina TaxID=3046 RepID=A0ABZ3KTK0_DUNSA|nr:hypothetical protein DUNSADRAFT_11598 [Dunaliella salina]|eukprot:KAF5832498.1 hypothetical protein DUNSADRAFT_11598 [Dunaliella salina]
MTDDALKALDKSLHVSNWADDVDDELPEEPPIPQPVSGGASSRALPVPLLEELQLQHTFEIGPFPGMLSDKEVGRFMSQWRVTSIASQGAGFFYVAFMSARDFLDCTRSKGFLNTFDKLQVKPAPGPLVEAAAQKGAFQPLQPGSTKNWQPLSEVELKGSSWRSGHADYHHAPPPPPDSRWRPMGAPPPPPQYSHPAPQPPPPSQPEGQPAPPKPKANPFGSAKPVDTASKFSVIERKTAEEKAALAAQELASEGRKHSKELSRELPSHLMPHPLSRGASGGYDDPRSLLGHDPGFPPKLLRRPHDPEPPPLVQPLIPPGPPHAFPPSGPHAIVLPPLPVHALAHHHQASGGGGGAAGIPGVHPHPHPHPHAPHYHMPPPPHTASGGGAPMHVSHQPHPHVSQAGMPVAPLPPAAAAGGLPPGMRPAPSAASNGGSGCVGAGAIAGGTTQGGVSGVGQDGASGVASHPLMAGPYAVRGPSQPQPQQQQLPQQLAQQQQQWAQQQEQQQKQQQFIQQQQQLAQQGVVSGAPGPIAQAAAPVPGAEFASTAEQPHAMQGPHAVPQHPHQLQHPPPPSQHDRQVRPQSAPGFRFAGLGRKSHHSKRCQPPPLAPGWQIVCSTGYGVQEEQGCTGTAQEQVPV